MVVRRKNSVWGPLGVTISASQPYGNFQRLQHSDLMLKFIYYSIHTLFNVCSCLFQQHWEFIWTFVKSKRGGMVRILSLPSTVHNFCPQICVHTFLSTDFCLRATTSVDIWSLAILIHCSCMRAHE